MRFVRLQYVAFVVGAAGLGFRPSAAAAQGCEPIRFTVPISLGAEGEAYQSAHQLRLTLAYRRLYSNEFFVGTGQNAALALGGVSPVISIHTFVGDVSYSLNDRIRLGVSVPFSTGSISRKWADAQFHEQRATGIGDVSVLGEFWLLNPKSHEEGNISLGLGLKAPTGSHTKPSQFYTATGPVAFPADQTVEPGDGGWGISFESQAFHRVGERVVAYGFGSYMSNPRAQSDATLAPTGPAASVHWSVPDVYQARLGAAFSMWPSQGLTVSLGGRIDGTPKKDLIGGGDETTLKRTSQIFYADPGISLNRGKSMITLSVPVRVHVNRFKSVLEESSGALNGGGFAKYLVFLSYSYRL